MTTEPAPFEQVLSPDGLRQLYPPATVRASRKEIDHLDHHCRRFIGLSPFCVLGTVDADGAPDLSPRGGAPGFVRVLDAHTATLADRPGNYRIDSLTNVVGNPAVTLLFLVPGIDETLRVYGRGSVVARDVDAKERTEVRIEVTKAYFHCAKALMRSKLWDPARRVERTTFPTMGELINEHSGLSRPVESQGEMLRRYEPTL